jgi:hypothetical protein
MILKTGVFERYIAMAAPEQREWVPTAVEA